MNWLALDGLEEPSGGWLRAIAQAGYEGVQFIEPLDVAQVHAAQGLGLAVCGSGRVNGQADAGRLAREAAAAGLDCLTVHVGWGVESEDEALRLIDAILEASVLSGVPIYPETHRATIFQDIWRTVGFVQRRPELRFNADLSHWYTGLEFAYGGLDTKLRFIAPVLERVEFMHGRIGTPGCMQVDIGTIEGAARLPFVQHFKRMWTICFKQFAERHGRQADFRFAPELLSSAIYYQRQFHQVDESDRWEQSEVLTRLARRWYEEAVQE